MTRVLKRPMFRLGGPANEGITSGLAPRTRYEHGGNHDYRSRTVGDLPRMTIGELEEMSKAATRGDRKADIRDFMVDWGLGMVGGEPAGNILATAAQQARAPYEKFQARKTGRKETEAAMFSTLFSGAVEAAGEAAGGTGWLEQWKFQQIPKLNKIITDLSPLENDGTITATQQADLDNARDQKRRIVQISPILKKYIESDEYLVPDEVKRIYEEDLQLPEDQRKYTGSKDPKLVTDAIENLERKFGYQTGGRVGYQAAGSVMGDAIQSTPAQTMPEELGNISYEELRSRLPQEVGDEIVRLLANSAEALEDFATIQTEQDIANFNKKYGVNLVLPAES